MAIKASELRLENLISYNGEPMPIFSIDRGSRSFYTINDIQINRNTGCTIKGGEDVFNPIPLTEKWMQKFGFVTADYEVDQIVWDYNDNFCIVQDGVPPENEPFVFEWEDGRDNRKTDIKYVHQLQNLYFALTGEELQIKEA